MFIINPYIYGGCGQYTPVQYTNLDGTDDYLSLNNTTLKSHLLTDSTFTITVRFRLDVGFATNQFFGVLWNSGSNQKNISLAILSTGAPTLLLSKDGINNEQLLCTDLVTAGEWSTITYAYDPATGDAKVLLNGAECSYSTDTITSGAVYGTHTAAATLGGQGGSYVGDYDLQDVSFHSDYKSNTDIIAMHAGDNPTCYDNLIHYFDSNQMVLIGATEFEHDFDGVSSTNSVANAATDFIRPRFEEMTGMMGQSNMAGVNQGADPANYVDGADDLQKTLVMTGFTTGDTGSFSNLDYEQNNSIPTRVGTNIFGPEMAYMNVKGATTPHYLVKCAEYGSGLHTSQPTALSWHVGNVGLCWEMARLYINEAFADLNDGVMRKFFWYQGHADCNTAAKAAAYEAQLTITLLDLETLINSLNPDGIEVEMILVKSTLEWVTQGHRLLADYNTMETGKANTAAALNNGTYYEPPTEYPLYDTAHITSASSDALGLELLSL